MTDYPRIVDEQYRGDPFLKLIEEKGKHYVFNESALIESEERMYRSLEMGARLGWLGTVPPEGAYP